jgi:single-strand DNA-binding protein
MANGVNEVRLIGNLGSDPETKFTQGGMAVTSMSVATTSTRKKDGQKIEETQWHRVKAFGKLAEICGEYLRKGSKVYIAGSIRYSEHTGQDGVKKYFTDIIADEMRMLDGKREDGGTRGGGTSGARGGAPNRERPAPATGGHTGDDFADDDIPFVSNRSKF